MTANAEHPIAMPHDKEQSAVQEPAEKTTQPPAATAEIAILLTPRQQRALLYISRRHMRHARIVPRPSRAAPAKSLPTRTRVCRAGDAPAPEMADDGHEPPTPVIAEEKITVAAPLAAEETPVETGHGHEEQTGSPGMGGGKREKTGGALETDRGEREEQFLAEASAHAARGEASKPSLMVETGRNERETNAQRGARGGQQRTRVAVLPKPPPPMPPLMPKTPTRPATPVGAYPPPITVPAEPRTAARKHWRRRKMLRHYARKQLRLARAAERRRRGRFWLSTISTLVFLFILLSSLVGAGLSAAYSFYQQTQRQYGRQVLTLQDLLPLDNLKMYDSKGVLIGQLADQGLHTAVTFDQIAPALAQATVATEDKNFWTNEGIDPLRILRSALDDVRSGRVVEGGSTITQQLIKNLVVGNEVTLKRKLQEIALTTDVNRSYSKSDILTMYLNSIYYGEQAYGIDAAAQVYFGLQDKPGKPASAQLDLAQSAMLAGIPVSPALYDPLLHPQAAFNRFNTVLEAMIAGRYITRVQALDAIKEEQSAHFFRPGAAIVDRAPHFFNFALQQLEQITHLSKQQLSRSGMQVYTTLDVALQDKIQKIAQQHVAELRAAHNVTNAAEVLIDYHTGAIISLLGSIDYNDNAIDGQFDVATQGYRQPGSSFKPYVYVTAFAQGASPAQAIDDAPVSIPMCCGQPNFTPGNYDLHFHGQMTLRCALQNSLNVPAVKVLEHVGIGAAMQMAYNMGITSYEGTPGYSLVLGGLGIRLIDQTSAMGVFANGGVRVGYYAINRVVFASTGKVLYQHERAAGKQVISPQLAYLMTSVLSDNTDRIPEFFDCNVLQLYANSQQACYAGNRGVVRPAAAKTGTTQDFRDNWTVGYTTDYVMGVWVGNDDNSPMIDVTGVQGAAPIWHDSMLLAEQGHPIRDFANPGGLVRATVTYPNGVKTTDWFLPGTVPTSPSLNSTPAGTATPTTRSTPAPITGGTTAQGPVPAPYCPADYSFAFPPPAGTGTIDGVW